MGARSLILKNAMKKLLIMLAIFGMNLAANAQTKTDSTAVQKDSTMSKITELESIASGVKNGYLLIENGVVKGYKAMESGIVKGFTSVNDAITLKLFGKDGETIEQTRPGSMPTWTHQEHEAGNHFIKISFLFL